MFNINEVISLSLILLFSFLLSNIVSEDFINKKKLYYENINNIKNNNIHYEKDNNKLILEQKYYEEKLEEIKLKYYNSVSIEENKFNIFQHEINDKSSKILEHKANTIYKNYCDIFSEDIEKLIIKKTTEEI